MSIVFKLLRLRAGMTLEEVAQATGVTRGYLSKVERGLLKPSVGVALKLAKTLRVPVEELFGEAGARDAITINRAGDARAQPGMIGAPRLIAGTKAGQGMIAFIIRPGLGEERRHPMSDHDGDELLYVLAGCVSIEWPDRKETLQQGDCAQFNGAVPHKLASLSGEDAEVLIVIRTEQETDHEN